MNCKFGKIFGYVFSYKPSPSIFTDNFWDAESIKDNYIKNLKKIKNISGGLPVLFMDVHLYRADKDVWDFCNSGNHASWYVSQSFDPVENFKKITFHPALEFYFKAGGASVAFDAAPGQITFARLGL